MDICVLLLLVEGVSTGDTHIRVHAANLLAVSAAAVSKSPRCLPTVVTSKKKTPCKVPVGHNTWRVLTNQVAKSEYLFSNRLDAAVAGIAAHTTVHTTVYTTVHDNLRGYVKEAWDTLPDSYLQQLLASMPERCKAVIAANGMHTKY